jgi:hypothetical protein
VAAGSLFNAASFEQVGYYMRVLRFDADAPTTDLLKASDPE